MFEYIICNVADEKIFDEQCKALENNIPNLIKGELVIDVDDSRIQKYILFGKKIDVYNDHYKDGIHLLSEVDLTPYFIKHK